VAPPKSIGIWAFPAPPDAPEQSRIRLFASSPESRAILAWFDAHQTGWSFSSRRFSPAHTQFVSDTYGIELLESRIVLEYQPINDSNRYDHATIERPLTDAERAEWMGIVTRIRLKYRAE
jgi:hypothetical protein